MTRRRKTGGAARGSNARGNQDTQKKQDFKGAQETKTNRDTNDEETNKTNCDENKVLINKEKQDTSHKEIDPDLEGDSTEKKIPEKSGFDVESVQNRLEDEPKEDTENQDGSNQNDEDKHQCGLSNKEEDNVCRDIEKEEIDDGSCHNEDEKQDGGCKDEEGDKKSGDCMSDEEEKEDSDCKGVEEEKQNGGRKTEEEEEENGSRKTREEGNQDGGCQSEEEEGEKENLCPDEGPEVIVNPRYLCVSCSFAAKTFASLTQHNERRHPGSAHFSFRKTRAGDDTVLEQSIEGEGPTGGEELTKEEELMTSPDSSQNSVDSTAQMDSGGQTDSTEDSAVDGASAQLDRTRDSVTADSGLADSALADAALADAALADAALGDSAQLDRLRALTLLLPESPHVSPTLRRPPSFGLEPRVAVPLHTAPYDSALDAHAALTASFTRFPYPTHAELSWLTAASRIPETTIRAWFSAQRLKRGITWSPEEVEEARKKMFNGSVPAAAVSMTTTASFAPDALRRSVTMKTAGSPPNALKRSVTMATAGPEAKRPVMAVAPNPGERRGLMAPPLLPLRPLEAKRVNANSYAHANGNGIAPPQRNKVTPLVSMPSMVFPESLTRPMIAPPPAFFPPFKNNVLVPRKHEATPISLPNGARTSSGPPISPQRRPAVIQSLKGNFPNVPGLEGNIPNVPAFEGAISNVPGMEGAISNVPGLEGAIANVPGMEGAIPTLPRVDSQKEQNGYEGNKDYNGKWVEPLDGKWAEPLDGKWVEPMDDQNDVQQRAQVLTQFPLLERLKGKSSEQLKLLEETFLKNSFPTVADVRSLASTAQLSPHEVDSWFSERRALRDNLEQALINSMGTKHPANANASIHIPNTNPHLEQALINSMGTKHPANANANIHISNPNLEQTLMNSMGNKHPANANASIHIPNSNPNLEQTLINSMGSKLYSNANANVHANLSSNPDLFNSMSSKRINVPNNLPIPSVPNGHRPLPPLHLNPHLPHGNPALGPLPHSPGEKALQNGHAHKAPPPSVLPLRETARWPWFDSDVGVAKTGSAMLPGSDLISPRCHNSTNGSNGTAQEAELNWFNKTMGYNRLDFGFGRWIDRRQDLSES